MTDITLYHNPQCSKSRAALDWLTERDLDFTTIAYLETPPSAATLQQIAAQLNGPARQMMRTQEALYSSLNLADPSLSEAALFDAMAEHPILIERPIVTVGFQAAIGRPIENIAALFPNTPK